MRRTLRWLLLLLLAAVSAVPTAVPSIAAVRAGEDVFEFGQAGFFGPPLGCG